MLIDLDLPRRAQPKATQKHRQTADAAKHAAHDVECAGRQVAAKQARTAAHAAEIAKQAGREPHQTARNARKAWDERVRSLLAATNPLARFVLNMSYLNSERPIPSMTNEWQSPVESAAMGPMDIVAGQTEPRALATLGENGDPRARSILEQAKLPAFILQASREREETTIAARAGGYGALHQEIPSHARFEEIRRSPQSQMLPGNYLEAIARVEALPPTTMLQSLLAASASALPPPADQSVRGFPGMYRGIDSSTVAQSLLAASDSAPSPPADQSVRRFPGMYRGIDSSTVAQSLLAASDSAPFPPADQSVRRFPGMYRGFESSPVAQSLSAASACVPPPPLNQIAQLSPGVSWGTDSAPVAQSLLAASASVQAPPLDLAGRDFGAVPNEVHFAPIAPSVASAFASRNQDPETTQWLEQAASAFSPEITRNRAIETSEAVRTLEPGVNGASAAASAIPSIEGTRAALEGPSLLARERLLGASEPTRGTIGGPGPADRHGSPRRRDRDVHPRIGAMRSHGPASDASVSQVRDGLRAGCSSGQAGAIYWPDRRHWGAILNSHREPSNPNEQLIP